MINEATDEAAHSFHYFGEYFRVEKQYAEAVKRAFEKGEMHARDVGVEIGSAALLSGNGDGSDFSSVGRAELVARLRRSRQDAEACRLERDQARTLAADEALAKDAALREVKALTISLTEACDLIEEVSHSVPPFPAVPAVNDAVDHPPHYTAHPSGVECITITEHFPFNIGNAIKYCWRAGQKTESPIEDLRKAAWYLEREILRKAPRS